jgi:energy-coupling factor transport system ATP-binding protein
LAEAAVLADLAVLIVVLARLTPFAGLTTVIGSVPFAVLGLRHRNRVLAVAFFVGVVLTFLMAGFSSSTQVLVMATFGGVVGRAIRHGWSLARTLATAVAVGWTTVAALTTGFLYVFSDFRQLSLDAAAVQWDGISTTLRSIDLDGLADGGDPIIEWSIEYWYLSVPFFQLGISLFVVGFVLQIGSPAIKRVDAAFEWNDDVGTHRAMVEHHGEIGTVATSGVVVQRGTTEVVLPDITLDGPGLTVVRGPNGAGKSTLLGTLVGRFTPVSGEVRPAGLQDRLGAVGGVAVVGQRPESQVVGARVADDLAWGFQEPPSEAVVADVLERVGLVGFEQRETAGLSGGELQRLAIAAALIREPGLLLSDESTSMLDPDAREAVAGVLRAVADRAPVLHITHIDNEMAMADELITLGQVSAEERP